MPDLVNERYSRPEMEILAGHFGVEVGDLTDVELADVLIENGLEEWEDKYLYKIADLLKSNSRSDLEDMLDDGDDLSKYPNKFSIAFELVTSGTVPDADEKEVDYIKVTRSRRIVYYKDGTKEEGPRTY